MSRTLVVVRHAKSDWSTGQPDHDRPLAPRGRRQAPVSGAWVREHLDVDLAVVSSAVRARQTWDLLGLDAPVRTDERVYAAWGAALRDVLAGLPDDAGTVVLVGHNPGLEELVEDLTGTSVPLPTSAVAVVDLPGGWDDPTGAVLRTHGRPPERA